jgi:Protein of unknown function (DUF2939)
MRSVLRAAQGLLLPTAFLLTLQACGKTPEAEPAVQALLTAVQTGDSAAFDGLVDRDALRADLRRQMIEVARQNGLDVGGPSDAALDRMMSPDAIHLTQGGAPLPAPPSRAQVAAQLKTVAKARVCLHDLTPQQTCLLTFAKQPSGWRLVGMPAEHVLIEIAPEPAKKG